MGVKEELDFLRNQGVAKKNASKLIDANGLSTPEAVESAIKAEHERNRIANYGKEAGDNLKSFNEFKTAVQVQGDCEGILSPRAAISPSKTTKSAEASVPQTNSNINTDESKTIIPETSSCNDSITQSLSQSASTQQQIPSPSPPSSLSSQAEVCSTALPTPVGEPAGEQQETKPDFVPRLKRFLFYSLGSRAVLSTFVVSLLLSFSLGMTIGIVPEVLTDRYARLYHGYGSSSDENGGDRLKPLLPCWEYDTSNMPEACVLGADDAQTGAAYGTFVQNLVTFFFNAVLGSYSDTKGRRPFLLVAVFLNALVPAALVAMEVIETMDPFWYYAANVATGFISFPSIIFAINSDDCPEDQRAGRFAVNLAGFYVGFAIAPMLPMYMSHIVASWWSFALAVVMVIFSVLFLPETLPSLVANNNSNTNNSNLLDPSQAMSSSPALALSQGEAGEEQNDPSLERQSLIHGTTNSNEGALSLTSRCLNSSKNILLQPFVEMTILTRTGVLQLVALGSFLSAAVYSIDSSLVLFYIEEHLNVREADIAIMFVVMGGIGAILQGLGLHPLVSLLGEQRLLAVTFCSGTVHNFLYGIASTKTEITAALSLSQLTKLNYPLLSSLASQQVGLDEQGRVQGALLAMNALAGAVGPVSMNWVYSKTKDGTHKPFGPGTMFLLSSGLYFLGTIVVSRIPSSKNDNGSNGNSNSENSTTNNTSEDETGAHEFITWEGEDLEEPLLLRVGETITL